MSIFHAYDIRGLYPQEVNPEIVEKIGAAFAQYTGAKEVIVGRDMRESCDELFPALLAGLASRGCRVIDIGLCSTPLFYFAVLNYGKPVPGIMITASHNPSAYNGLKMVGDDGMPFSGERGLKEIESLMNLVIASEAKQSFEGLPRIAGVDPRNDAIPRFDPLSLYIQKLNALVPPKSLSSLRVAIDAGNGMGGYVTPSLFKTLPLVMHPLFFELDGNFPNHEANPIVAENLMALITLVRSSQSDIGIAYDGDADRVGVIDERGRIIPGDILTALLATELLKTHKGATILYDVRGSRSITEVVEKAGGHAEMTRVGHSFIKQNMKKTGAIFAGELSGHFYYNEFNRHESGDYTTLLLLKMISESKKHFSELVDGIMKYFHSGEINFDVSNKQEVMDALENEYRKEGTITKIDGIRIDFQDWWFNVRASNTEPKLRLNLEATTRELMEQKKQEITQHILSSRA